MGLIDDIILNYPLFQSGELGPHSWNHRKHDVQLVLMSPDVFLDAQFEANRVSPAVLDYERERGFNTKATAFEGWKGDSDPGQVRALAESLREGIDSGNCTVPVPFIELFEGTLTSWQEGRHRGLAALAVGLDLMPVYLAHCRFEPRRTYGNRRYSMDFEVLRCIPPESCPMYD